MGFLVITGIADDDKVISLGPFLDLFRGFVLNGKDYDKLRCVITEEGRVLFCFPIFPCNSNIEVIAVGVLKAHLRDATFFNNQALANADDFNQSDLIANLGVTCGKFGLSFHL